MKTTRGRGRREGWDGMVKKEEDNEIQNTPITYEKREEVMKEGGKKAM